MTKNPSATILLPTFNEAENIVPLIKALLEVLPTSVTLFVVDDNSPDGTALRVETSIHKTKTKRVKILVRKKNPGLTNSLRDGISKVKTDAIGWMDCDFSHPPEAMATVYEAFIKGYDIVVASRFLHGGKQKSGESFVGSLFSNTLNRLCQLFFGSDVTDYTSGFLIAKRTILEKIPLRGDYGEYCIDLLVRIKQHGGKIHEIPFESVPRRAGLSKTAPNFGVLLKRSVGYAAMFFRLLKKG